MKQKTLLLLAMLLFGSIGVFISYIDLPSVAIVQWRAIFGTLFLAMVLLCRRQKIDLAQLRANCVPLVLSGIFLGANWAFLFSAYAQLSVGLATIIYYFAPILVLFCAPILFHEHLHKQQIIGIACAMLGMILVNAINLMHTGMSMGIVYACLSALLYAAVMITNKYIHNVTSMDSTLVQLFISAVIITLYCTATTGYVLQFGDAQSMAMVLVLGIVHTGIAYLIYFGALQQIPAQDVAIFSYLDPASALVFSAIFLHETLSVLQILGAVFICGGTLYAQRIRHKSI